MKTMINNKKLNNNSNNNRIKCELIIIFKNLKYILLLYIVYK